MRKFILEDGEGQPSYFTVSKSSNGDCTVTQINLPKDYTTVLELDGNGNVQFEYKHGNGYGVINIPQGTGFDITIMMGLLQFAEGNLFGDYRIYEDGGESLFGRKDA